MTVEQVSLPTVFPRSGQRRRCCPAGQQVAGQQAAAEQRGGEQQVTEPQLAAGEPAAAQEQQASEQPAAEQAPQPRALRPRLSSRPANTSRSPLGRRRLMPSLHAYAADAELLRTTAVPSWWQLSVVHPRCPRRRCCRDPPHTDPAAAHVCGPGWQLAAVPRYEERSRCFLRVGVGRGHAHAIRLGWGRCETLGALGGRSPGACPGGCCVLSRLSLSRGAGGGSTTARAY
jgi:hypothetical protein